MASLRLIDLEKQYGRGPKVLEKASLDVEDGELLVIVGPSGCGKSTLLRMIAGLEEISAGDLLIDGERANDVAPSRRGVAMVFQNYALYPHMTVARNLAFPLRVGARLPKKEADARVMRAAEILQLTELLDRYPRELSGGQRQRVAIGRAIVRKPKIFLFDEPLSNLDAALRVGMRIELAKLHQDLGTTMIYVTHDQVEAMTLGQRIVVMRKGVIEQIGRPLELYDRPANRFVASFLGSPTMNFLPCQVERQDPKETTLRIDGVGPLVLPLCAPGVSAGARAVLGVRPEHLEIGGNGPGVPAKVVITEELGDTRIVYTALAGDDLKVAVKQPAGCPPVKRGETVVLRPRAEFCHLFEEGDDGRRIESRQAEGGAA